MALTFCPDCRHAVSDRAEACPNCGRPLEPVPIAPEVKRRLRRRYRLIMLLSLLATGAGAALSLRANIEYLALVAVGLIGFGVARSGLKNLDR